MESVIYIQLLKEGTIVYRPVLSTSIAEDIYKVGGDDIYDAEDELWQFPPHTIVIVEERELSDGVALVAIGEYQNPTAINNSDT
jgi:hypothetical protein